MWFFIIYILSCIMFYTLFLQLHFFFRVWKFEGSIIMEYSVTSEDIPLNTLSCGNNRNNNI